MTTLRMKEDRAELLGGQRHEIIGEKRDSNFFTDWLVDDREKFFKKIKKISRNVPIPFHIHTT